MRAGWSRKVCWDCWGPDHCLARDFVVGGHMSVNDGIYVLVFYTWLLRPSELISRDEKPLRLWWPTLPITLSLLTWIQPRRLPAVMPQDLCMLLLLPGPLSPQISSSSLCSSPSDFYYNVCLLVTSLAYLPHSTHTDSFSLPLDTYYSLINNIPCLVWQGIIYYLTSSIISSKDGTLLPHSHQGLVLNSYNNGTQSRYSKKKAVILIVSGRLGNFNILKRYMKPFTHSLSKQGRSRERGGRVQDRVDTGILLADSCQCLAKTILYEVIILQLKWI